MSSYISKKKVHTLYHRSNYYSFFCSVIHRNYYCYGCNVTPNITVFLKHAKTSGLKEKEHDHCWILQNPYNLSADPCGSSSGSAIAAAANMVAVTLGTETDGSILCPSTYNSVVGIKPTVGLTSRAGVVPISPRQDTVGY